MANAASRLDFDEFYLGSATRLVRHGYALTGDMAEAQDIAQEAFARAWQRWATVRDCDSPEAWVRRVATNLAASRWRRIRVARTAGRHAAEQHAPEVALHGHIHEAPGEDRIGRTLCLNPGSEYANGILRAYVLDFDAEGQLAHHRRIES